MPSATIKIYLPHGDPKRLRTGEISNWSGKAVAGPRTELDQLLKRDEASSVGIYLLTGIEPSSGGPAVYIGEAESIQSRLKQHLDKDFWNHVVYFTSKDENLKKSHIRYLEGRLIELAKNAVGRVLQTPKPQHPSFQSPIEQTWKFFWKKLNSCSQLWALKCSYQLLHFQSPRKKHGNFFAKLVA